MLARVAKLEAARAVPRSPFELAYGSLGAFEDATMDAVRAGKLDSMDWPVVLTCIRRWHDDRLWGGFKYHRNGAPEFVR